MVDGGALLPGNPDDGNDSGPEDDYALQQQSPDTEIRFIGVTYEELASMDLEKLRDVMERSLLPYMSEAGDAADLQRLVEMRDGVRMTRRNNFRFAHNLTESIEKERIRMALSGLARLFRLLDEMIKSGTAATRSPPPTRPQTGQTRQSNV